MECRFRKMPLGDLSSFMVHPSESIKQCRRMNITSDSETNPVLWTDETAPSPFGTPTLSTFRNPQTLFIRASHSSSAFARVGLQEYSLITPNDPVSTSVKSLLLHILLDPRAGRSITTSSMAPMLSRFFLLLHGSPALLLYHRYGPLASSNLASVTIQSRR